MDPETYRATGEVLRNLLTIAWLLPLAGFAIEVFGGYWGDRLNKSAAYIAVLCIGGGFACSTMALIHWGNQTHWAALHHTEHSSAEHASAEHGEAGHGDHQTAKADRPVGKQGHNAEHGESHTVESSATKVPATTAFSGTYYILGLFGSLQISLDYYIDSLTLVMFTMVTLIATCIHVFALGYMSDELTEDHVDHQVHVAGGGHLHRPGRYYRFFSYMSLFCFSMLGLVLSGNIFMVFIFWELVGICSYLLIGFYTERKTASTAANKAFIVNRVGDFGFVIGLMVLWTSFGTFHFAEHTVHDQNRPGLFQMLRGDDGQLTVDPDTKEVTLHDRSHPGRTIPYFLLVVAGLGIFAGCIGKSAQFPLQVWLPDAMEGPTPVSALVHSATMVAAGVYLAGRFYPMFTPEVLLVIAYIGCITLFVAATIAVVATDIKRVLAYSTISQLGYMMLGIGVAGWTAGLFHLITHAFFKSLLFLCSGSVIVGCHHEQEMPKMGGLLRKMPITALTMLVGVVAISGLALFQVRGVHLAFSGYHSKDAIVATALAYMNRNPHHFLLFVIPLITAGITAFYMFRLWFYTFLGKPRDQELHDHAHESPAVMTVPLLILALFAAGVAFGGEHGPLYKLLQNSEPAGVAAGTAALGAAAPKMDQPILPGQADVHAVHAEAGLYALIMAFAGMLLAYPLYAKQIINPADIKRQFASVHRFLVEKWEFDTLYDVIIIRPVHVIAGWCAAFDRKILDGILHTTAKVTIDVSRWDRRFDEKVIDGLVNLVGTATFAVGRSLRVIQTGRMRQYVMFIAVGVLALFVLMLTLLPQ